MSVDCELDGHGPWWGPEELTKERSKVMCIRNAREELRVGERDWE